MVSMTDSFAYIPDCKSQLKIFSSRLTWRNMSAQINNDISTKGKK